jgi:methionyl-tRNA formyltransferase
MPLKLVFFGNTNYSLVILRGIQESKHILVGVVTSPDKPAGRGLRARPTPLRAYAKGDPRLLVLENEDLRSEEFLRELRSWGADLGIVAAYGRIIPIEVIRLLPRGMLNLHPSLLPRLRGPAPIQRSIMEGARITGVSLVRVDEGVDTGDIVDQEEVEIDEQDTFESLEARLAHLAVRILLKDLDLLEEEGKLRGRPQDEAHATYAPPIEKRERLIDWSQSDTKIFNQVRALYPRPGAFTFFRGKRVKIMRASLTVRPSKTPPGTLTRPGKGNLSVSTGSNDLLLLELQPEGSRVMTAGEFLRGQRVKDGEAFVSE